MEGQGGSENQMTSVGTNRDFAVKACHVATIALEVKKTEDMSSEWDQIMRLLLTRCDDATTKSKIEQKLLHNDVFGAAVTTLNKWVANESDDATFSVLLETIHQVNPSLKCKLHKARENIRSKDARSTLIQSNQIPVENSQTGNGNSPETSLLLPFLPTNSGIRTEENVVLTTDATSDINLRERGKSKLKIVLVITAVIILPAILTLANVFGSSLRRPEDLPKKGVSENISENPTNGFVATEFPVGLPDVFHNGTIDDETDTNRVNCSKIKFDSCGNLATAESTVPMNNSNSTNPTTTLGTTGPYIQQENFQMEVIADHSSLTLFDCAPMLRYTCSSVDPIPLTWFDGCELKELTLLGNISSPQFTQLLLRIQNSLEILKISDVHMCKEYIFKGCQYGDRPHFKTLKKLDLLGFGSECVELFKYLGQCVDFQNCFQITIDNVHLTVRDANDIHVLAQKSCKPIQYGNNVTGVKIESGVKVSKFDTLILG